MNVNFLVSKNAVFAYVIGVLSRWNKFARNDERGQYEKDFDVSGEETKSALSAAKILLSKKDTGFLFLWDRYIDFPFKNLEDEKTWKEIREVFEEEFESIFKEKYLPALLYWKDRIEQSEKEKLDDGLLVLENILCGNTKRIQSIQCILLPQVLSLGAVGSAKREFSGNIILNVPIDRAFGNIYNFQQIILHEVGHQYIYNPETKIEEGLMNSYKKIIQTNQPENFGKIFSTGWKSILSETMMHSIVSGRVGRGILGSQLYDSKREEYVLDFEDAGTLGVCRTRAIFYAASLLEPLTFEYIKTERQIDQTFCDVVATIWQDDLLNREDVRKYIEIKK